MDQEAIFTKRLLFDIPFWIGAGLLWAKIFPSKPKQENINI
jgi:hypothetical protein